MVLARSSPPEFAAQLAEARATGVSQRAARSAQRSEGALPYSISYSLTTPTTKVFFYLSPEALDLWFDMFLQCPATKTFLSVT